MGWLGKKWLGLFRGQRGIGLMETLVALAILGAIAVTFVTALATATRAGYIADERTTAESLARSQMERVKEATYVEDATEYSPAPIPGSSDYLNYSVIITAEPLRDPDDGIQKVTVTVKRFDKRLIKLESYKRQQ